MFVCATVLTRNELLNWVESASNPTRLKIIRSNWILWKIREIVWKLTRDQDIDLFGPRPLFRRGWIYYWKPFISIFQSFCKFSIVFIWQAMRICQNEKSFFHMALSHHFQSFSIFPSTFGVFHSKFPLVPDLLQGANLYNTLHHQRNLMLMSRDRDFSTLYPLSVMISSLLIFSKPPIWMIISS